MHVKMEEVGQAHGCKDYLHNVKQYLIPSNFILAWIKLIISIRMLCCCDCFFLNFGGFQSKKMGVINEYRNNLYFLFFLF